MAQRKRWYTCHLFIIIGLSTDSLEEFKRGLKLELQPFVDPNIYTFEVLGQPHVSIGEVFKHAIQYQSTIAKKRVVILIDEYDSIVSKGGTVVGQIFQSVLAFFEVIKDQKDIIELCMLTGIVLLTTSGSGSGLNNVEKITANPLYSDLVGFTEEEIIETYGQHLAAIERRFPSKNNSSNNDDEVDITLLMERLRYHYNGFYFSDPQDPSTRSIFSPWEVISFLSDNLSSNSLLFEPYWVNTNPSYQLIQKINLHTAWSSIFSEIENSATTFVNQLLDIRNIAGGSLSTIKLLLYSSGYLTFKRNQGPLVLAPPNDVIGGKLASDIREILDQNNADTQFLAKIAQGVRDGHAVVVLEGVRDAFQLGQYSDFRDEHHFQSLFTFALKMASYDSYETTGHKFTVSDEVENSVGRLDVFVNLYNGKNCNDQPFIFELKYRDESNTLSTDKDGEKTPYGALHQICEKEYWTAYEHAGFNEDRWIFVGLVYVKGGEGGRSLWYYSCQGVQNLQEGFMTKSANAQATTVVNTGTRLPFKQ